MFDRRNKVVDSYEGYEWLLIIYHVKIMTKVVAQNCDREENLSQFISL